MRAACAVVGNVHACEAGAYGLSEQCAVHLFLLMSQRQTPLTPKCRTALLPTKLHGPTLMTAAGDGGGRGPVPGHAGQPRQRGGGGAGAVRRPGRPDAGAPARRSGESRLLVSQTELGRTSSSFPPELLGYAVKMSGVAPQRLQSLRASAINACMRHMLAYIRTMINAQMPRHCPEAQHTGSPELSPTHSALRAMQTLLGPTSAGRAGRRGRDQQDGPGTARRARPPAAHAPGFEPRRPAATGVEPTSVSAAAHAGTPA